MAECNYERLAIPFVISLILLVAWIFVLKLMQSNGKTDIENDVMNRKLFNVGDACCSWWPVTHFVLFAVVGYFNPYCDLEAMLVGVVWEGFELFVNRITPDISPRSTLRISTAKDVQYKRKWWGGSVLDIYFNALGFYTGKMIRGLVDPPV